MNGLKHIMNLYWTKCKNIVQTAETSCCRNVTHHAYVGSDNKRISVEGSIRMTRDGTNGEAIYSRQKMVNCVHFCAWNIKMDRERNQHKTTMVQAESTYIFLGFADEIAMLEIPWDSIISANLPETDDQPMRRYVEGSQLDRNGDSILVGIRELQLLTSNHGSGTESSRISANPTEKLS